MNEISTIPNTRLVSLDVFRGLTVAAMILVINPGDWGNIYAPLKHAEWNGCTPADLIFPFFLFIVGVSIVFSLSNKKAAAYADKEIIISILKRGALLFLLGIILALLPYIFVDPVSAFTTIRIPGVLQRIGLVFIFCAILFYKTGFKTQVIIFVFILILYWALLNLVHIPGIGSANMNVETNLGAWLDRTILTEAHLWKLSRTWDPEGILGTLPAIATGISGLLTGSWLRRTEIPVNKKLVVLIIAGLVVAAAGLIWNTSFPMNKALWTSSYVLFTSGLAAVLLAVLYWIIDVKSYKSLTKPFVVYGVNAVTVFFMSAIINKFMNFVKIPMEDGSKAGLNSWLYKQFFTPYFTPLDASLAWAIFFVLFWLMILWLMYKRKIIIKV